MSTRSSGTFCMFFCPKPWPMNSQWRSSAARAIGSYDAMAPPLIASKPGIFSRSKTSSIRQKPTRFPYSCHAQLGTSGIGEPPAGGVRTVRGIGSRGFHSSTLTITHTASRAPPGSVSRGRVVIGEYVNRSVGSIPDPPLLTTLRGRCSPRLHDTRHSSRLQPGRRRLDCGRTMTLRQERLDDLRFLVVLVDPELTEGKWQA